MRFDPRMGRRPTFARGFTLLELLVVIAVVSLLLSLLIPAVFDARRAAARARCAHQSKQVELATQAFEVTFNAFPKYWRSPLRYTGPFPQQQHFSVFSQIVPFLDLASLHNQINFQVDLLEDAAASQSPTPDLSFHSPANTTVMATTVAVLLCPSDPAPTSSPACKGSNYRANYGTSQPLGHGEAWYGPFEFFKPVASRDVTDGLSHTAAFSEKPRGDLDRRAYDRFVDPLLEPINPDPPARYPFEYCVHQPITPPHYRTTTGINWLVGGLSQTCYNHMEVPNGRLPDCLRQGHVPAVARATARSYHGAGANVALADGSVRFVTSSIHDNVWQALGSRAGGEVFADEDW